MVRTSEDDLSRADFGTMKEQSNKATRKPENREAN
jgi:hypothetical protein